MYRSKLNGRYQLMNQHPFDHNLDHTDLSEVQNLNNIDQVLDNHNLNSHQPPHFNNSLEDPHLDVHQPNDFNTPLQNHNLEVYQSSHLESFSDNYSSISDQPDHSNSLLDNHNLTVHQPLIHESNHNQFLADSHSIAHQRMGSESASDLLKEAQEKERWANDRHNEYEWHTNAADDFRKSGNFSEADSYDRDARTDKENEEKWRAEAQELRNKADQIS